MDLASTEMGIGALTLGGGWFVYFVLKFMDTTKRDIEKLREDFKAEDKALKDSLVDDLLEIKGDIRNIQVQINKSMIESAKISSMANRVEEIYTLMKEQSKETKLDVKAMERKLSDYREDCVRHRIKSDCE